MFARSRFAVRVAIVASLWLVTMLAACDFRPRGSVIRLTDLGSIYVDTDRNVSITEAVKQALSDSAFQLAKNRDEADILLRLANEEQAERVISVNSTGRVSELELSHAVNMLVAESVAGLPPTYQQGQRPNRVEVIREYTYDETGVLGKENEARILRAEMETELVRQIILRTIATLAPSVPVTSVHKSVWRVATLDREEVGHNLLHGLAD